MAVSSACTRVTTRWTGSRADALRQALGITYESFAGYLGISARTAAYWHKQPDMVPQLEKQDILDTAFERAPDHVKERFARLVSEQNASHGDERMFGVFAQQLTNGVPASDDACVPPDAGDAVTLLDALAGADMEDRPEVTQGRWATGSVPGVITGYLFSSPTWQHQEQPLLIAPRTAAARIRATAKHLMDIDFQFGGGYVRRMLLFYFRSEIVPMLREPHPGNLRSEIFGAAAEVAQLLGWSAYDAGRHGAAQRYFLRGLRLANEAGDPVLGGRLLSNLSHQANYLGHFDEALQFARAAQASARGRATDTVTAMFLAMEARALASSGDARMCAQALHLAEQAFARRDLSNDPEWIGYFDELELAGEAAHCFRELGQPRETQMFAVRAIDPVATPARTRAFISMVTAAGAFRGGNLDEALAYASDAVSMTSTLQSSRYVRYLTDFHWSVAERHSANPAVRQFTELITRTYPAMKLRGIS